MGESRARDEELVLRAREGDREAFAELVRSHQGALLSTARHLLGDGETAREAAQEAFLKAWSRLGGFAGRGTFRAWLFSILRHTCTDMHRKRARAERMDRPAAPRLEAVPPAGEERLRRAEQRQALDAVLDALTPRQRLALLLSAGEGCSAAEVAAALGCAAATARVTLFQARRKALRLLEVHMEGLGVAREKARETLLGV